MSSAEPATSVFVSTSRDHPLHMWDAFTGNLRATYRAYDHLDEVVAANSVCFNAAGDKIFAGMLMGLAFARLNPPEKPSVFLLSAGTNETMMLMVKHRSKQQQ